MHFIPLKKEPSNYSKCSAFASSALLHLFFNSNSGAQEYFLPQGAGYPSYVIDLEGSRPRTWLSKPRTSKNVLEAKDDLEAATSAVNS